MVFDFLVLSVRNIVSQNTQLLLQINSTTKRRHESGASLAIISPVRYRVPCRPTSGVQCSLPHIHTSNARTRRRRGAACGRCLCGAGAGVLVARDGRAAAARRGVGRRGVAGRCRCRLGRGRLALRARLVLVGARTRTRAAQRREHAARGHLTHAPTLLCCK